MGVIIGTAGHIDHGKTSLVKALTGQDTDRLKEEKERGISIDLGFAYLDLPDGTRAGIVDVPGHERFIRNMLAGAHGIDLVLFVVAADDGVMPQTEEHLDIVHLLRVPQAIFIVAKVDLVPRPRVREVEDQIRALVAGTAFERAAIVPYSFVTGAGLDEIRRRIAEASTGDGARRARGHFRLPVDRVFVLHGHGLIVTGTAIGGDVKVGDRVRCQPGQHVFRVRSLQVHHDAVQSATEGQRVALNLAGPERPSIGRGHTIVDEALTMTSDRVDTWLELRRSAAPGLKNHQRVRVHHGTAERLASLRLLGGRETVGPNESTYCQIVLTEPMLAMAGDRFIIRDETARRTLGGGVVVHPWPRRHTRAEAGVASTLDRLRLGAPATRIETFLDEAEDFAVPAGLLQQYLDATGPDVAALVERVPAVRMFDVEGERLYTTASRLQGVTEQLLAVLGEFHAAHPLAAGMDVEAARDRLSQEISAKLFRSVVDQLAARGQVVRDANLLRLRQHVVRLKDDDRTLIDGIAVLLAAQPLAPPGIGDIETQIGLTRPRMIELIRLMERDRLVVRVGIDLYFVTEGVDRAAQVLRERWSDGQAITPAAFRDAIGTTRKYAIPLLEYFDRAGVTIRAGDVRRLRSTVAAAGGTVTGGPQT